MLALVFCLLVAVVHVLTPASVAWSGAQGRAESAAAASGWGTPAASGDSDVPALGPDRDGKARTGAPPRTNCPALLLSDAAPWLR